MKPLLNPVAISNPVVVGICDASVNTRDTFSGSGCSLCSIWAKTGVTGGRVSVWMDLGAFSTLGCSWVVVDVVEKVEVMGRSV